MSYVGGPTFLAKALSFAAGILCQEQNFKNIQNNFRFSQTPKHNRPQVTYLKNLIFK